MSKTNILKMKHKPLCYSDLICQHLVDSGFVASFNKFHKTA